MGRYTGHEAATLLFMREGIQRKGEDTSEIEKAIETALINETALPMGMTADDQDFAAEFTEIVKVWSDEGIFAEICRQAAEAEGCRMSGSKDTERRAILTKQLLTIEWLIRRGYTIS